MKRNAHTPPNQKSVTARYKRPVIDKLLGRTTLEWDCENGSQDQLTASLRFTDYEGNMPSWYSITKLPFVLKTYLQSRRSPLMQKPVPFLTMDAIRFLDNLIRPGMRVLEIGGGNSSLWFLERGVNLLTYEHDHEWAMMVLDEVKRNPEHFHAERFNLRVMKGKDTLNDLAKLDNKHFDIVLVDSMNDYTRRTECIRIAKEKVKEGGWIVLDNSDNPANWAADEMLDGKEMFRFTGYSPMSLFVCQTTFWKMQNKPE
jgi:predicted O-methyltransferase YrrM